MDKILALLNLPLVLAALQWGVGALLKKHPTFPNQFIPLVTYLLALFGFAVVPAPANAASTLAGLVGPTSSIFLAALVQNLLVTGAHSTWKNSVIPALTTTIGRLFGGKAS